MSEGPTARVAPPGAAGDLEVLVFAHGGVTIHPLERNASVVIGRGPTAGLRIEHESISREHMRIRLGPAPDLEDLGSVNGTRVGGQPLASKSRVPLPLNVMIEIGSCSLLVRPRQQAALPVASPMGEVDRLVGLVADSDLSVLVVGETGVGKEVVAERIHALSRRRDVPLVKLNCAALSDTLLESELFGHERGAFTGAVAKKMGLVETADGGTLFLDEIGELPTATQAKLLRVLESGEILPLGGVRSKRVDVRFVAATHRNLPDMVQKGQFREDLYFRLDGLTISIPPLRERKDEIEPLARRFAAESSRSGEAVFTPAALSALRAHAWPGNIRELRKVIARAVLLSGGGPIEPQHLALSDTHARLESAPALTEPEAEERRAIESALTKSAGNQTRAASILGISRRTLIYRLEKYGFIRPRK